MEENFNKNDTAAQNEQPMQPEPPKMNESGEKKAWKKTPAIILGVAAVFVVGFAGGLAGNAAADHTAQTVRTPERYEARAETGRGDQEGGKRIFEEDRENAQENGETSRPESGKQDRYRSGQQEDTQPDGQNEQDTDRQQDENAPDTGNDRAGRQENGGRRGYLRFAPDANCQAS